MRGCLGIERVGCGEVWIGVVDVVGFGGGGILRSSLTPLIRVESNIPS